LDGVARCGFRDHDMEYRCAGVLSSGSQWFREDSVGRQLLEEIRLQTGSDRFRSICLGHVLEGCGADVHEDFDRPSAPGARISGAVDMRCGASRKHGDQGRRKPYLYVAMHSWSSLHEWVTVVIRGSAAFPPGARERTRQAGGQRIVRA